jgi:hypothetical protein
MVDYLGPVAEVWIQYVFGSAMIGGLVIMFFLALWGIKRNWSLDMYVIVFIPIIMLMTSSAFGNVFGSGVLTIFLVGMGLIIGLALIKMTR